MKKLALAILLFAVIAMAADVSGNWSGILIPDTGQPPQSIYLVLHQTGDQLTGTGGPNAQEQFPMQNGRVQGDRLTFEVPAGKGSFVFDLKVSGDEGDSQIKGNAQIQGEQTVNMQVSLRRIGTN